MEFQNKIEITGIVGRCSAQQIPGTEVLSLSVVTERSSLDSGGHSCVEFTWFQVTGFTNALKKKPERTPGKGDWVKIAGYVRNRRYTTSDGEERSVWEVVATEIELVN